MARDLKDPEAEADAPFTAFTCASADLNLQECCHSLVLMGTATNADTETLAYGRVHRIGQGSPQKIRILRQDRSHDGVG